MACLSLNLNFKNMNKVSKTETGFESQKKKILKHLVKGFSITPLEALKSYGCFRLAAVVFKLKNEGFKIKTEIVTEKRKGVIKKYGKYTIVK